MTLLVNNLDQTTGSLSIRDAFFNPQFLKDDPTRVGRMLKGLASQNGQEVDLGLVDGVRNNLFGPPGAGGLDLAALDIHRGRDHGLPDFNNLVGAYRALGLNATGGVVRYTSFDALNDPTSFAALNPRAAAAGIVAQLKDLYPDQTLPGGTTLRGIDNIDPFVGMLAEDLLPGASVGRTLNAIIGNQFARLRDGDRFFYTGDAFLQSEAVRQIRDLDRVSLADIIRRNTQIVNIQDNVFFDRSVVVIKAPESGSNLSVVAGLGALAVVDNHSGQVLALRSLESVSQVILFGSHTAADVFNIFIAAANGGLEDGVIAYGGNSTGDRLNVYGLPLIQDTFTVDDSSFSTGNVDVLARGDGNPDENAITQAVTGRTVTVNDNVIQSTGFETTRLVTLGGDDIITGAAGLAEVVNVWNPFSND
jgi:hypothetical protein